MFEMEHVIETLMAHLEASEKKLLQQLVEERKGLLDRGNLWKQKYDNLSVAFYKACQRRQAREDHLMNLLKEKRETVISIDVDELSNCFGPKPKMTKTEQASGNGQIHQLQLELGTSAESDVPGSDVYRATVTITLSNFREVEVLEEPFVTVAEDTLVDCSEENTNKKKQNWRKEAKEPTQSMTEEVLPNAPSVSCSGEAQENSVSESKDTTGDAEEAENDTAADAEETLTSADEASQHRVEAYSDQDNSSAMNLAEEEVKVNEVQDADDEATEAGAEATRADLTPDDEEALLNHTDEPSQPEQVMTITATSSKKSKKKTRKGKQKEEPLSNITAEAAVKDSESSSVLILDEEELAEENEVQVPQESPELNNTDREAEVNKQRRKDKKTPKKTSVQPKETQSKMKRKDRKNKVAEPKPKPEKSQKRQCDYQLMTAADDSDDEVVLEVPSKKKKNKKR